MTQRGTVFGVAEDVFDLGAVAVPVLDAGGVGRGGHLKVGQDERIAIDRIGLRELI